MTADALTTHSATDGAGGLGGPAVQSQRVEPAMNSQTEAIGILMGRCALALALAAVVACEYTPTVSHEPRIVFLTRPGCTNTQVMRAHLDVAVSDLSLQQAYSVVDLTTLRSGDRRGGYPTPTVLVDGRDLFGMPEPPLGQPPT